MDELPNGTVVLAKIDMWDNHTHFCHRDFYYRITHADATYYSFGAAGFRIRKELLWEAFEPASEHRSYPLYDDPLKRWEKRQKKGEPKVRKHPFTIVRRVPVTGSPPQTKQAFTKIVSNL